MPHKRHKLSTQPCIQLHRNLEWGVFVNGSYFRFNPGTWPKRSKESEVNSHLLQSTLPNDLNCNRRFDILFGMLYCPFCITLFSLPALSLLLRPGVQIRVSSLKVASLEDYRKHAIPRDTISNRRKFSRPKNSMHPLSYDCGSGRMAGPDLAAAGDKFSRADLIQSILEPSANIMTGYSLP